MLHPFFNNVSLNNVLHTGRILQFDLFILLLDWRLFQFVFNADVEKRVDKFGETRSDFPEDNIKLNTIIFLVNCNHRLAIR